MGLASSEVRVPVLERPRGADTPVAQAPPVSEQGLASSADAHGLPVGASRSPLPRRPAQPIPRLAGGESAACQAGDRVLRAEDPVATSVTIPRASRGHRQGRQRCRRLHEADAGLAEITLYRTRLALACSRTCQNSGGNGVTAALRSGQNSGEFCYEQPAASALPLTEQTRGRARPKSKSDPCRKPQGFLASYNRETKLRWPSGTDFL